MRRIFVDSSGFYAPLDRTDVNYNRAKSIYDDLANQKVILSTTNAVIFETYALILNRLGRKYALALLDAVEVGDIQVIRVTEEDEKQAISILRKFGDKPFSFCDALSFAVMERLDISEAIAFDVHFTQYGKFTIL